MQPPSSLVNGSQTPDLRGLGIPHRKKLRILQLYGRRRSDPVHVSSQGAAQWWAPLGCGVALPPSRTASVVLPPPSLRDGSLSCRPPLRAGGVLEEESLRWKRSPEWRPSPICRPVAGGAVPARVRPNADCGPLETRRRDGGGGDLRLTCRYARTRPVDHGPPVASVRTPSVGGASPHPGPPVRPEHHRPGALCDP